MRVKFGSLALAVLVLMVSVSVAFADRPTPGFTPPGKGGAPPGQEEKTPEALENKESKESKGGQRHGVFGSVASKGSNSFTVTTKQGPVTVTVTASTKFHIPRNKKATLADLAVGDRVAVNGTPSAGGLVAKQVMVAPGRPTVQHRVGEVTAYTAGSSITIKTVQGDSETFALTASTTIKNPKGSGVAVGDRVTVVSRRDPSTDTATASGIVVHPKEDKEP